MDLSTQLGGRFAKMAGLPQSLMLDITAQDVRWALFELRSDSQGPVIKHGLMVWLEDSAPTNSQGPIQR